MILLVCFFECLAYAHKMHNILETSTNNDASSGSGQKSISIIGGAVAGSMLFVVFIAVCIGCCCKKWRSKEKIYSPLHNGDEGKLNGVPSLHVINTGDFSLNGCYGQTAKRFLFIF